MIFRARHQPSTSNCNTIHLTHLCTSSHGELIRRRLPDGHSHRCGHQLGQHVPVRCSRRHPRRHLRQTGRSKRGGHQRGNTFPDSLAAAEHHLRCPNKAPHDLDYNRKQGFADGQLNPESAPSPGGEGAAQDLSGMSKSFCQYCNQ
jgi:hypothetical protein